MMVLFPVSPEKQKALEALMLRLGIREEDFEEGFVKGTGPGGQKINKSSVAVALRHGPTGLSVRCQESRSQALNRFLARRMLVGKIAAAVLGQKTEEQRLRGKIRRQKRRRSRRAKERMLADKRHHSEKKILRGKIRISDV